MNHPIKKDRDSEFERRLTQEEYAVTRRGGTEAAFSGKYNEEKRSGDYVCVCCQSALFSSEHKYDSGSGWPSFFQAQGKESLRELVDEAHGLRRTEVRCAQCDAHLGHVFPDGPQPTGLRYCINSLALHFSPVAASSERK